MKKLSVIASLLILGAAAFAQSTTTPAATTPAAGSPAVGEPNPADLNPPDQAQQDLVELSISKFEDDGSWIGTVPRDDGFISLRRIDSTGPIGKRPLSKEEQAGAAETEKYVLGGKVEHLRRAVTYYEIKPIRPIPVPGISKMISVWVVGRNVKHTIYVYLKDQFGNDAKVYLGELSFTGWRELKATVPPNLKQADMHYNSKQGITLERFVIEPDPVETYGSYYFYFDDLRVTSDLFSENRRDPDDMADNW